MTDSIYHFTLAQVVFRTGSFRYVRLDFRSFLYEVKLNLNNMSMCILIRCIRIMSSSAENVMKTGNVCYKSIRQ